MRHRYIGYIVYAGWIVSGALSVVVDVAIWQWVIMVVPIAIALGIAEIIDG